MKANSLNIAIANTEPRTLFPRRIDANVGLAQPGRDDPMHMSVTSVLELNP